MQEDPAKIARKIDELDHPDAIMQDAVLAELSRHPDRVRPVVLANLPLVSARVRRALLRWLVDHLTAEATLPLMRYVFDEQGNVAEESGRALAMGLLANRAQETEAPDERGRLRGFAEDISSDTSPEVRRLSLVILANVGDERAIEVVELLRSDADAEVRRAAHQALQALSEALPTGGESEYSKTELLAALTNSAGARRRQLLRQFRRHPERAQIALAILRAGQDLRSAALQTLLKEPVTQARPYLAGIVLDDPASDEAALAMRLLARLAEPDDENRPDEIEALRRALRSSSALNVAAACAAIEALQLRTFIDELTEHLLSRELSVALASAQALAAIVSTTDQHLLRPLCQAVEINDRRRSEDLEHPDRIHVVAHLLTALRHVVTPRSLLVDEVIRLGITALRQSGRHRPIRVTALQLLVQATPKEGLNKDNRWGFAESRVLLQCLSSCELDGARRVALLLQRTAPIGLPGLDDAALELWRTGAADLISTIIPLLDRAETKRATERLRAIGESDDQQAAEAARKVLRRRRNDGEVIDAQFIPRDE